MKELKFRTHDHGTFDEEWPIHQKSSEWWYATGYLHDEAGNLYSYQYTLMSVRFMGILHPFVLMVAVTDFQTKKHYYSQKTAFSKSKINIDETQASWLGQGKAIKTDQGIDITAKNDDFGYDLKLDYGKGAFWHCDNGVLKMGIDGEKEHTLYFSYTNMPTTGTITIDGKTLQVKGKSWFDKQGGPYSLYKIGTMWEWFSMRFYDDEEIMLFSFPQSNYQDGTYIPRDGSARRLQDYTIKPHGFTEVNGVKFSVGWDMNIPGIKDESYRVEPIIDGQLNLAYFEQLARIYNSKGEEVGLCFVELLPGVLNKKIKPTALFKKV